MTGIETGSAGTALIDADGVVLDSFSVKPATHPEDITTDGTSIWIVDKDSDRVFRFDIN